MNADATREMTEDECDRIQAEALAGMAEEGFHWHRCADCLTAVCHLDEATFWMDDTLPSCDEPRVPFNAEIPADLPPASMICERGDGRRWSRNMHARRRELRQRGPQV